MTPPDYLRRATNLFLCASVQLLKKIKKEEKGGLDLFGLGKVGYSAEVEGRIIRVSMRFATGK